MTVGLHAICLSSNQIRAIIRFDKPPYPGSAYRPR